ncbi:ankyrin repeat domain-containing protein [Neisseria leonii]|uniref:Ankyrin repeat domain-containing protein n=1 Tax=Neisseria leonii TaxID=2995413 RepID=A0A9X4E3J2_9NEIS|nr:ankyrin repeat domain-containing protein [Neisseria sp. 51.81]MDD9328773.1 ankyrin repeat domain-containing protein [Neisseria sp. 51.81]
MENNLAPMTVGEKIAEAEYEGNLEYLQEMIDKGFLNPLEITPNDKWNYLHTANIWRPSPLATIRFYLDKGVEVNAQDCYGMTPLHYALRAGNADAAIALLEAGADPNIPNIDNLRPLSMAGYTKDRLDVLELMLKNGGNVHNIINDNETILESWKPNSVSSQWQIDIYELMKKYA